MKYICTLKTLLTIWLACIFGLVFAQNGASISFEQVIALRSIGTPILSPDGKHLVYTVGSTDWKDNSYDTEIWLAREGEEAFQLTRSTKGSSTSPKWSPDGKWIAFTSSRNDKSQIFVIRPNGGEAQQISNEDEGVGGFEWSPDGKQFAITKQEPEDKEEKKRKERYGGWAADDAEYRLSHLWLLEFKPDMMPSPGELPCYDEKKDSTVKSDCITYPKSTRLTGGSFTVSGFDWSPDGKMIVYNRQPNPLINYSMYSDIEVIDVASKQIKYKVANPSVDNYAAWSPDSKKLLYTSSLDDTTSFYYKNDKLFVADLTGGKPISIAQDFDEDIGSIVWNDSGIFFAAFQRTKRQLFRIDMSSGQIKALTNGKDILGGYSFSKDGKILAYSASTATTLSEIFKTPLLTFKPVQLTNMSKQIANWKTAVSEVITWKSKDGAEIEGVLHKPQNFDPSKKYPLLVMIHGGPTGIDLPQPVPGSVYPVLQWLEKGALVLRVNYRGSAGYGEKFRSLNVRNLGVGDMWDVMSGVDFLIARGSVDPDRMGCMGWSQGGYISAFLTTNTDRFKAISVGAGISNWMTYYVNTDIHPFTRQYLQATPWDDPEIYRKTSPMSTIKNAKTPTLIQHGEFDRRVPIPNAYELLQGLQDNQVPAKLVVYKGFGHGINKPKERLAALWHNWQWFNKYVWGEEVELPVGK
ncbi:alpha/beta hydrolase family protein [Haliscomenobacter hydrossis]|uniref:Peptidase S9 prolyl oligopeptidase n=1 Tax=Haliscomenobacter hydrossis (strain ATCC 27775 / DSM 1100 / LMG 10767 / O) TaxID=760192 RepID=F4KV50_HALH1|nr:S9 family peptidase [Haliscomenobacter hydrossis]AEE49216.1 peptidase S9 prolyl oligopeptidase [Haliscomenobacter hydrossis DSM 1100]